MERDVSDRIRSSLCDFGGDSVDSVASPESQARSPNLGGPISTADVVWFCGVGSRLLGTSVVRSTEARCNSIGLMYMGALLFGAVKLGFLSGGDALNSYTPYILPVSILASVGVYLAARESLESSQSE